jgi:hypothetical protein
MTVADTAKSVSDTAQAIAQTIDASPLANATFDKLANAVVASAGVAGAAASGNPIAITGASIQAATAVLSLEPEMQQAWAWLTHLFVHTAKSNPAVVKAVVQASQSVAQATADNTPA